MFEPIVKHIPYAGEADKFPGPPLGWIMHVQVGNGDPYNYFAGLEKPHRKFSSYWISKRGVCKQYQIRTRQSWAQGAGNPFYWSVEFEGFPNERISILQVNTAARLHNLLRTPDAVVNKPGGRGIGTHSMGGEAWGGHACPGPIRAAQRLDIIGVAQNLRNPYDPHPFPGTVKLGSHNGIVRQVQSRLNHFGHHLVIDGIFGQHTDRAVRSFQGTHGLAVDGIVGPLTWKRLWS